MENVYTQIQRRYRSLSSPQFFFVSEALQKRPYKEVIEQIRAYFQVEEDTDPNDDVSFGYLLSAKPFGQWLLRLSMVGAYAVLFRILGAETIEFVSPKRLELSEPEHQPRFICQASLWEKQLLNILKEAGICLMDRQSLIQPVPMILFNVEPEKTCLYHSLFTDVDVLPWDMTATGGAKRRIETSSDT